MSFCSTKGLCFSIFLLVLLILYSSFAWQFTSKTKLNQVFILQRKCLCIINVFYKDHSNSLFKDLILLKLHDVLEPEVINFSVSFVEISCQNHYVVNLI